MAGSKDTREDLPYIVNPVIGGSHNQSAALRIIARNRGYDPDAIYDSDGSGRVVGSMVPFDREPTTMKHSVTEQIPGGAVDSWQDGVDLASRLGFDQPTPFSHPNPEKENKARRTTGADPYAGMPPSTR